MRVISGTCRGRRLFAPRGSSMRPTLDRVKEAIFNIIGDSIINSDFIDLYAGTGSIGIEALSRGARAAYFVEKKRINISLIKRNLKNTSFNDDRAIICQGNVFNVLKRIEKNKFKHVFMDPPYNENLVMKTLECLMENEILKASGIIIAEHGKQEDIDDKISNCVLKMQRAYGDSVVSFFQVI